jgi:hypothetical protein
VKRFSIVTIGLVTLALLVSACGTTSPTAGSYEPSATTSSMAASNSEAPTNPSPEPPSTAGSQAAVIGTSTSPSASTDEPTGDEPTEVIATDTPRSLPPTVTVDETAQDQQSAALPTLLYFWAAW